MEGCLKEISLSPADINPRLAHLECEVLRHVDGDCGEMGELASIRRRGIVLCDSEEAADALLDWMKRDCQSVAKLNPAKLNLTSRKSHRGKLVS